MITPVRFSEADRIALNDALFNPELLINDFLDYSKVVVKKPWGYEYLMYQNGFVAVWILYIKEGFQTSMHCHPNKKTSLVVLSGEALCSTINTKLKVTSGEGLLIDKATFHSTKSISKEGIFVMEIETPINKRDLIRLKDEYGRVGQGYESVNEMSYNIHNYNYISFIEPEVYYNAKKKFANCSISFARFKDYSDFKENFEIGNWDVVCLLKGNLLSKNKEVIIDIGDTISFEHIQQLRDIYIYDEIEVIIIKRRDNMIKLSDYVANFLQKKDIREIFLVPGSANVHLLDSIGRNTQLQHIYTQTEEAATLSAEAYAKLKNKISAVIISSGTSATRALTGVADAWVDSTPILIISGQSQSDLLKKGSLRQLGIQELDIIPIVNSITKYSTRITDPFMIRCCLEKAVYLAQEGRPGPVWLEIPIDIQGKDIDEEELISFEPPSNNNDEKIDILKEKAIKLIDLIRESKRPVILAGNGIKISNAEKEFFNFVESLSIPVLTTKSGADIIVDEHKLSFGRPGAYGQRSANFIIQNSDLLISIGARLSLSLTGRNYKSFARAAKKAVVDIDQEELNKTTLSIDLAINADVKYFLKEFLNFKDRFSFPDFSVWINKCSQWKERYFKEDNKYADSLSEEIDAYLFMDYLSKELKEGAILTIDGGSPIVFAMQRLKIKKNQRLISAVGLDNYSFALPSSIGASIAVSGKEIICLCEDSGFQKNIQELETIKRFNLPIKIFILNNGGCSYIKNTQQTYFGGRLVASDAALNNNNNPYIGLQKSPNFEEIAKAYGLTYYNISNLHDLVKIKEVLAVTGSVICNIHINPSQQITPRICFRVTSDGKWLAKPLEEMYPFLDRKELKENMFIPLLDED